VTTARAAKGPAIPAPTQIRHVCDSALVKGNKRDMRLWLLFNPLTKRFIFNKKMRFVVIYIRKCDNDNGESQKRRNDNVS